MWSAGISSRIRTASIERDLPADFYTVTARSVRTGDSATVTANVHEVKTSICRFELSGDWKVDRAHHARPGGRQPRRLRTLRDSRQHQHQRRGPARPGQQLPAGRHGQQRRLAARRRARAARRGDRVREPDIGLYPRRIRPRHRRRRQRRRRDPGPASSTEADSTTSKTRPSTREISSMARTSPPRHGINSARTSADPSARTIGSFFWTPKLCANARA